MDNEKHHVSILPATMDWSGSADPATSADPVTLQVQNRVLVHISDSTTVTFSTFHTL